MKITEISAQAGRTFNHPYEQFSNFKPEVRLVATLAEGDDPEDCAAKLQLMAETMAERQKQEILTDLKIAERREHIERRLQRLDDQSSERDRLKAELEALDGASSPLRQRTLPEPATVDDEAMDGEIVDDDEPF